MTAVHVIAAAPGGPIMIAVDPAAGLGRPVAHVEPCPGQDAEAVAQAARQRIAETAIGAGWFGVSPLTGKMAVEQAKAAMRPAVAPPVPAVKAVVAAAPAPARPVPARVVADAPEKAAHGPEKRVAGASSGADVRSIRLGLGMTQAAFAAAYGLPAATLAGWEQGRFRPDGPAQILLRVIERRPDAVREALATP